MIDGGDVAFKIRLAYTLKKTIQEIEALPSWEVDLWRIAFEVFGPLDWRRLDLLFARNVQMQLAKPLTLRECVLFPAPEDIEEALKQDRQARKEPQSEEEALAIFTK